MINTHIIIKRSDMYLDVRNTLNKVAESMRDDENFKLMYHYQPDLQNAQDKRLLDKAFSLSVKEAVRTMAQYIDTHPAEIEVSPDSLNFNGSGETQTVNITSDGAWMLVIDNGSIKDDMYIIWLEFPDTWLNTGVLQEYVSSFIETRIISHYLENVDKNQAGWYRKEADDKEHEIRTICASRKPGTRFRVTSPFGENPYRRY